MHTILKEYVDKQLDEASGFVLKYLPINLTTNQIYESLIEEPHVIKAFAEATQYLPTASMHKRVDAMYGDTNLKLLLRFQPTEKYNVFLMPKYDLKINSQSELGKALALPVKLATDWEMLSKVWSRMAGQVGDVGMLALLFPWLQEIFIGFDPAKTDKWPKIKSEQEKILREVRKIMAGRVPNRFPRLTARLNEVCRSGRTLLSQYRMLEATFNIESLTSSPVSIERMGLSLPEWLNQHMDEVLQDWAEEELERTSAGKEILEYIQKERDAA